jgi:hypothetical protein
MYFHGKFYRSERVELKEIKAFPEIGSLQQRMILTLITLQEIPHAFASV